MLFWVSLALLQAKPSVTLSFPPTPMPKALEILSNATGRKLATSTAFFDDVVLARLKDAPADATLNHLAEAFLAKWVAEPDGTLRLVKDLDAMAKAERVRESANRTLVQNSLKYLKRRLAEEPAELDQRAIQATHAKAEAEEATRKTAEAAKDYSRMFLASSASEESPAWRALARILPILGEKTYLDMPNDAREVWSEGPTPMQHAFPPGCEAVLQQYRREFALMEPNVEIARVRVVLKKWETTCSFNTEILGLNRKGEVVDKSFARMNDDSDALKQASDWKNRFPAKPGEKPISVPAEATNARIALSTESGVPGRFVLLDKWRPHLLDPVRYEPTTWHTGADLIAAAEATGQNLIGSVSDVVNALYWKPEKKTPSQVLARNAMDVIQEPDGWLVARSYEPRNRASRSAARVLLTASVREGGISVDRAADWVGRCSDRWPFVNWIGDYLCALFTGSGPYSALSTTIDDTSLRLWDSLGQDVRMLLRSGRTIALNRLPPGAMENVRRLVYWYEGLDDSAGEPTEKLPNGIEGGEATLTIDEKPVFAAWASKDGPPASPRPMDADSFGKFLARGNSYWEVSAEVYRAYDRFRLGTNRTYVLHFVLQSGSQPMTIKLSETLFDPNGLAIDRLPDSIRAQVEQAREKAAATPLPAKTKEVIPPLARF